MSAPEASIVVRPPTAAPRHEIDDKRAELLRRTTARDLTADEFGLFIEYIRRTGLDPFTRQIHALKIDGRLAMHVGIDGLRLVAERSGGYGGQLGPFWKAKGGAWLEVWEEEVPPYAAKAGVVRSDFEDPVWGIATWPSHCQRDRNGRPRGNWSTMPDHMLAKVAEAIALRKAFPRETAGLYVQLDEEGRPASRPAISSPTNKATNAQLIVLVQLARELGWDDDERRARAGVGSFAELNKARANELIDEWGQLLVSARRDDRPTYAEGGYAAGLAAEDAADDMPATEELWREAIALYGRKVSVLAAWSAAHPGSGGISVAAITERELRELIDAKRWEEEGRAP